MIQGEWPPLGLGEAEERAYEALLLERAHRVEELARLLGLPPRQVHTALARLVESGLARPAEPPDAGGLPHPTAPETALRTLIHRRQAELHRRSAELARLRLTAERLAEASWTGPGQAARGVGGVEPVTGVRAIAERVGELVAGAGREVLVMDDRPDAAWLDLAAARAAEGVPVRVVLDRAGLGCPAGRRRTAALTGRGLRLRTAAAGCPRGWSRWTTGWRCFHRPAGPRGPTPWWSRRPGSGTPCCPCSRRCGPAPHLRAGRGRPPGPARTVHSRSTSRAGSTAGHSAGRPGKVRGRSTSRVRTARSRSTRPARTVHPLSGGRARTARGGGGAGTGRAGTGCRRRTAAGVALLLAAGLKDEAIARRLGVHVHTARRRITRLLDALDARTRFQAGARATARGWLQP
ncbi:helix-turn-helix domain-containing protein [Streptomyces sp. CC210A]|uniref:helix-turn-helix domain-containing protein n=1 Tax=Streptomyces sp. CC210A TaxID=2898184 RepID=UPI001F386670|nr:helix-turn-helix domain-containing protein [Streptomyces sp. CC210A]